MIGVPSQHRIARRALSFVPVALLLLAAPATVLAQPSIASTAGQWTHKGSVTIAGAGFGTKTTAAPVIWDDASGTSVDTQWDGAWPNCSGNSSYNLTYRTPASVGRNIQLPHNRSTKYIAGAHYSTAPGPQCGYAVILWKVRTITSSPSYWYWSYYQRADNAWHYGDDDNFKTYAYSEGVGPYNMPNNWYLEYNPRPTSNTSGATWHLNDDAYGTAAQSLSTPDANGHSYWWGDAVNPMAGKWSKIEIEAKYTSASDGYIKLWENGVLKIDYKGKTDGLPGKERTEGIGGYARNYPYTSNWRYFSDVYLDYSRARVILGNAPTFAASTVREVQVPTNWSSSSITVTTNLGGLADGATAYLYVVDPNGQVNTSGLPVTLGVSGPPDTTMPATSITAPASGATVSNTVTVSASASDNVGVVGVQFKVDGVNAGAEDTAAPYSMSWNTAAHANGAHVVTAVARDAAGNQTTSASITVTASNVDATPPAVSLTSPAGNTTLWGTNVLTASASDNVGVAGVQFRIDGVTLGAEDTTAPYSATWDTAAASEGPHVITAVARDSSGNQATSAGVTVTVSYAPPPVSGPVGVYSFDAGSGTALADGSGNNNAGTIAGATWSAQGRYGSALQFDGTSSLVTIPDSASLDLSGAMTLEAWINPSNAAGWRTVMMKEIPGGLAYALYANESDPRPSSYAHITGQSSSAGSSGGAAIPVNTWTHLATTYDGATLRLFVNGVEADSVPVTGAMMQSANPLRIGGNSVWGEYFEGLIDEVRIYNRALTATEIQGDMASPITTAPRAPSNVRIVQ